MPLNVSTRHHLGSAQKVDTPRQVRSPSVIPPNLASPGDDDLAGERAEEAESSSRRTSIVDGTGGPQTLLAGRLARPKQPDRPADPITQSTRRILRRIIHRQS